MDGRTRREGMREWGEGEEPDNHMVRVNSG